MVTQKGISIYYQPNWHFKYRYPEFSIAVNPCPAHISSSAYLNNSYLLRVPFKLLLKLPQSERWMYLPSVTECNDVCTPLPFSLHLCVGIGVLPLLWLRVVIRELQVNPSQAPQLSTKSSLIMIVEYLYTNQLKETKQKIKIKQLGINWGQKNQQLVR